MLFQLSDWSVAINDAQQISSSIEPINWSAELPLCVCVGVCSVLPNGISGIATSLFKTYNPCVHQTCPNEEEEPGLKWGWSCKLNQGWDWG